MTSDNSDFGGISSMLALADNRFLFLNDAGVLIGFTLDEQNNTAVRPFIAPLPDGPAKENEFAKVNWDAESLVYDQRTGQYWVGYEHYHELWRYGPSFARKEAANKVPKMQKWPQNGGAEAMLRLVDQKTGENRFLVFSEKAPFSKGGYQALIFDGDPAEPGTKAVRFGYQPPDGYNLTDTVLFGNDQALLLHRRFTPLDGFSAILSVAKPSEIKPDRVWTSTKIATLKPPMRVDNMEALAVTEEGGEKIIWIASDDNFNAVQETILLKFRLLKGKQKRKGPPAIPDKEKAGANPGFSSLGQ